MERPQVQRRPLERGDLERIGIPEAYWRVRLEGLPSVAGQAMRNYVQHFEALAPRGVGVALGGKQGVGKTSLVAITLRELRVRGYSAYFLTTWDLREAQRTRAAFDEQQTVIDRMRTVDVLALDGLRAEDMTDPFLGRRAIEEILSNRAAAGRPSLITTRMTFGELDDPKGLRGFLSTCRLTFVQVDGADLREAALQSVRSLLVPAAPVAPFRGSR